MSKPPLEFGGQEQFQATPERLFAQLTDLDAMTRTIPDLVSSERAGEHTLKCVVRPGFSFLRGTLKLEIALADLAAPSEAAMRIAAQGIGVSMRIASNLHITPTGGGSQLDWQAQVEEIKGLAAALSPSLVKAAAEQIIRHAWTQVRGQLGE